MESLLTSLALVELLQDLGVSRMVAVGIERLLVVVVLLVGAVLADFVARKLLVKFIHGFFGRTRVTWDDRIVERGVLLRLSRVAPALVLYAGAGLVAPELPWVVDAIRRVTTAWIILVTTFTIDSLIDVFHDLYRESGAETRRPIKGLLQLAKVILVIVAGIVVLTTLLNQSPFGVLGGIGAMSAVLMLVFRDSILGLVSGIQLSANNMVRIGDWIEMPKYDADGDVIDITLQSIKVQN